VCLSRRCAGGGTPPSRTFSRRRAHEFSARHAALHCAVLAIVQRARSLCGPGAGPGSVSGAPWLLLGGMRRGGAPGHEAAGASAMPQARCGREPGRRRRRAQDRDNFTQQPEVPEALAAAQHIDRAAAEQGVLPLRGSARRAGGLARHPLASRRAAPGVHCSFSRQRRRRREREQPQAAGRMPPPRAARSRRLRLREGVRHLCGERSGTGRRHARLHGAARRAHTQAACPRGPAPRPRACVLLMRRVRSRMRGARSVRWHGAGAEGPGHAAFVPRPAHAAHGTSDLHADSQSGAWRLRARQAARRRRGDAHERTCARGLGIVSRKRHARARAPAPRPDFFWRSVLPHRARRRNIQLQLQCRGCGTARLSTPALTLPSTPARRRRRPSHAAHAVLPLQHLRHAARSAPSPRHSLRCKSLLLAQAAVSALPRRPRGLALPAARVSACAPQG
jgi:hypothetical protein